MPTHKHADTEIGRSFHLPRTLNARMVEVAAEMGIPVAELLRRAIVALLDRVESGAAIATAEPRALQRRVAAINERSKPRCKRT